MTGVSFVVPVHNGAETLGETLQSIAAQDDGTRPFEILVVDDGSRDGSRALAEATALASPVRLLDGTGRGAAAAINAGVRAARHPIVCQIDQDVVLEAGWLVKVLAGFDDPRVGAVQGRYVPGRQQSFPARVMALDLDARYASLDDDVDHVCTGNTAYRAAALRGVGLLDERLGYGYDNDLSYRLSAAGHRLRFCREATSRHRWRDGLAGYLVQQYGFGYGRLDVVAAHPSRVTGDAVSPVGMMAHPVVMALAVAAAGVAMLAWATGRRGVPFLFVAAGLVAGAVVERAVVGIRTWRRTGDAAALAFPAVHLARDLAWVAAMATWTVRRLLRRPGRHSHSMTPRPAA